MMEKDSAAVWNVLPYSFICEGSKADSDGDQYSFDPAMLRTLTWATSTTDDGPKDIWNPIYWTSPDCKWNPQGQPTVENQVWAFDEVIFCLNEGTGVAGVDGKVKNIPLTYKLDNNYPNPFNPTTTIKYGIPVSNDVKISIFNSIGQQIRTLVDQVQSAGTYEAIWDGRNDAGQVVPSGMYFYKMQSSRFVEMRKMILMK